METEAIIRYTHYYQPKCMVWHQPVVRLQFLNAVTTRKTDRKKTINIKVHNKHIILFFLYIFFAQQNYKLSYLTKKNKCTYMYRPILYIDACG